jgi:glucose/arabinose dehydrogenase
MTIRLLLARVSAVLCLTALLTGTTPAFAQIRLDTYVSGLSAPVEFVQDPTNPSVQYVVEQFGLIRVIQNGVLQATPFLDASAMITAGGERGLLGLAFSPDYATSGRFFVDFTDMAGNTVVARFRRSAANPLVADPSTRFDLRWGGATGQRFIVQPFANHNGGHLAFGPDGYLYVALGDGGDGGDPLNNSQTPTTFLGKLLRIDVNVADGDPNGYVVPADNPFVDNLPIMALPEIWAFGLRNPWKFTFDDPAHGGTGAMLIGDVGQASFEEVDYQAPGVGGRNYGWRIREGLHAFDASMPPAYLPLIDPIIEYDHSAGNSITGGVVYRGTAMRSMYRGRYFYADFIAGRLWSISLTPAAGGEVTASALIDHGPEVGGAARIGNPSAFGVDAAGEMYLVSYSAGTVLKIVDTQYPLTVSVQGSGTVTSGDGAIQCPSVACGHIYASGTTVTLQATPLSGFVFSGWSSSACSSGTVLMDAPHSCTAIFLARGVSGPTPGSINLNGTGFGDVLTYNPRTGTRASQLSDGQAHFGEIRAGWSANWQVSPADFNGDGLTDFFLYNATSGQWYKAINDGAGDFTYFAGQWSAGWQVFIVDLNGDHHSDAFVYDPRTGDWFRCASTGTGTGDFAYVGGHWSAGWQIYPADLNGDGKADFFLYNAASGFWYQAFNDGVSGFQYQFGTWSAGWTITPGDFNGDGRTDFFLSHPDSGEWYVATTLTPSGFAYGHGQWSMGWTFTAGDFNGDGKADLFLYNPALGSWYEAISDGAGSFSLTLGQWSADWQVQVTDFNGDGHSDVLLYNPTSGQWYQAVNAGVGAFTYGTGRWEPGLTVVGSTPRSP